MRPSERDLQTLGPYPAGANNVALETSVPARSFREGINVDVTDDGKVARRAGYEKLADMSGAHSLFGHGQRGFFARGTELFGFVASTGGIDPTPLFDGLRPGADLTYTTIEPDLFISDGEIALRVAPDDTVSYWSLPLPDRPLVSVVEDGSLEAARYMLAIAYKTLNGEEGPLSPPVAVDTPPDSRLAVELPPNPPSGATRVAVYMTKPNGTGLLLAAVVPAASRTLTIIKQNLGRPPVTQDADPMPAGRFSCLWNGRLLVASGNHVMWSEPNQYGVTKAMYNYLSFSEEVTMLAAIDTAGGFFVGLGSHTYFVSGADPADARLVSAYTFGAVPGTSLMVPGARLPFDTPPAMPVPMWVASNGVFCVGLVDGTVVPLTETRFAGAQSVKGAALFDQRDGINRYIATLRDPSENAFAMGDYPTAEVVRNNIRYEE